MKTYKCITCDRTITTDQEFPDGQWACPECKRNGVKIQMTCSVCGKKFPIQFKTWELRTKRGECIWRCRRCNDDYRNSLYEAKSPEEKAAFVAKQVARVKAYYANMSDEERAQNHENRKQGWVKRYESGHAEESLLPMKEGRKKWWDSLTDEERKHQWDFMNNGRIEWWGTISDEDRNAYLKIIGERSKESWDKLSADDRAKRVKPLRDGNRKFWEDIMADPDRYYEWKIKTSEAYRKYKESVNPHTGFANPSKVESEFMNILNLNNLNFIFQIPSTKVPANFKQLFPINPVTKATLIDPIHMWDFGIRTASGLVLIDVDGSIHFHETYRTVHPYTHVEYSIYEYNKFKDSQRPYQTDGLPAYAVLCPDDKITKDNVVIDINTGKQLTLYGLIGLLKVQDIRVR